MRSRTIPGVLVALIALLASPSCGGQGNDGGSEPQAQASPAPPSRPASLTTETIHATEVWDPYGLFGGRFGGGLTVGTYPATDSFELRCPGAPAAQPDSTGFCPAGSKVFVRNFVFWSQTFSNPPDNRLTGWVLGTGNFDLDEAGTGNETTSFIWYVGDNVTLNGDGSVSGALGVWEGRSHGTRVKGSVDDCRASPFYAQLTPSPSPYINPDDCWVDRYELVGRGTSGTVDGKQARITLTAYDFQLSSLAAIISVDGEIF